MDHHSPFGYNRWRIPFPVLCDGYVARAFKLKIRSDSRQCSMADWILYTYHLRRCWFTHWVDIVQYETEEEVPSRAPDDWQSLCDHMSHGRK